MDFTFDWIRPYGGCSGTAYVIEKSGMFASKLPLFSLLTTSQDSLLLESVFLGWYAASFRLFRLVITQFLQLID